MNFCGGYLINGNTCTIQCFFCSNFKGAEFGGINGLFRDICSSHAQSDDFNSLRQWNTAAFQTFFRNNSYRTGSVGYFGTIKNIQMIYKGFTIRFHHSKCIQIFGCIVMFLGGRAEARVIYSIAEPAGQGFTCFFFSIFFIIGSGTVAELTRKEIGMTMFAIRSPTGSCKIISTIDGLYCILYFDSDNQNNICRFSQDAFYTTGNGKTPGCTGSLNPNSRFIHQSFINKGKEPCHICLSVKTGGNKISHHTFINIGSATNHFQGSLSGFFNVMFQTRAFFFGIKFLATCPHRDGIVSGYYIYFLSHDFFVLIQYN